MKTNDLLSQYKDLKTGGDGEESIKETAGKPIIPKVVNELFCDISISQFTIDNENPARLYNLQEDFIYLKNQYKTLPQIELIKRHFNEFGKIKNDDKILAFNQRKIFNDELENIIKRPPITMTPAYKVNRIDITENKIYKDILRPYYLSVFLENFVILDFGNILKVYEVIPNADKKKLICDLIFLKKITGVYVNGTNTSVEIYRLLKEKTTLLTSLNAQRYYLFNA